MTEVAPAARAKELIEGAAEDADTGFELPVLELLVKEVRRGTKALADVFGDA